MSNVHSSIRLATPADLQGVLALCVDLWPDEPSEEVRPHIAAILDGTPWSTLFVAEHEHVLVGFVEVGLRSHAEGCDARHPVGFIDGWYVRPGYRRSGIGRALIDRAERWSREQGALELASNTWADHQLSIDAHRALGFDVVESTVHFRKPLPSDPDAA